MSDQTPPLRQTSTAYPFHTRYGFSRPSRPVDTGVALTIEPYPEICHQGALRRTILVSAVDLVASLFVREQAGLDVTFTSDLSLRAPRFDVPDSIDVRARILRAGKRLITTAVLLEADGERYAYGESTFMRLPRETRPGEKSPTLDELRVPSEIESNPLTRPLADEVGIETMTDGGVRLRLRDDLLNPEGVLQGALVALLVECAALAWIDDEARTHGAESVRSENRARPNASFLTGIDLRYLAAARVGPIVGRATRVAHGDASTLRVELRDTGVDDRITTTALVGIGDASPS